MRLVYLPWKRPECNDEYLAWARVITTWKSVAKECDIATYENRKEKLKLLKDPTDVLYIGGHGQAGVNYLLPSPQSPLSRRVEPVELCNQLQPVIGFAHLSKSFKGKIKFFNCSSAVDENSFAYKASEKMIGCGWNKCSYYGYAKDLGLGYLTKLIADHLDHDTDDISLTSPPRASAL